MICTEKEKQYDVVDTNIGMVVVGDIDGDIIIS